MVRAIASYLALLTLRTLAAANHADLLAEAESFLPYLTTTRRELHKIPEFRFEEVKTSAYIREALEGLGIAYKYPFAKTGIVATIGSGLPIFALRADFDGLVIEEEVDIPYKSTHPGRRAVSPRPRHCVQSARLLKARGAELGGTVLLMFQCAEEGGAGAKVMLDEGALEGASGIFGLHVAPMLASGEIASRSGVHMGATDKFIVRILGKGGHGGLPQDVRDVVVAAAAAVMALQPLVSRETSPTEGAIVGVTRFNTGPGSNNIHADECELTGTLNSLTTPGLRHLKQRFTEVVTGAAALYKCSVEITWPQPEYIAMHTDAGMTDLLGQTVSSLLGADHWHVMPDPVLVAEDFAFLSEAMPGAFAWLGIRNETAGSTSGVHTAQFVMDEAVLPIGASLHAAVALDFFAQHAGGARDTGGKVEL